MENLPYEDQYGKNRAFFQNFTRRSDGPGQAGLEGRWRSLAPFELLSNCRRCREIASSVSVIFVLAVLGSFQEQWPCKVHAGLPFSTSPNRSVHNVDFESGN
jgi:hypothetical protein